MTKFIERVKVINLRKEGKSYSEIKKIVKVSKSSLSLWLRDYPLSSDQLIRIKVKKEKAIEIFRETMRKKREARLIEYYKNQKNKWLPLSEREFNIAGLFLYWGEGNKASRNTISISNTDPGVLEFALSWMTKSLNIPKKSIKIGLQLYSDMNIPESIKFWSNTLNIPVSQFIKPYIKKSKREGIDQKGFGFGTCNVVAQSTFLKENILMAIKAISDNYAEKAKF